jgi:rhodanese-related sulfurtransferase
MIENLDPQHCFAFMQTNPDAVMIDVRTKMEHTFLGRPVCNIVHVAWKEFPDWQVDPDFVAQVRQNVKSKNIPLLLLCRSGVRSLEAAKVLEQAGYTHLINILEGFEGNLDAHKHRGTSGGWRFHGLPWEQS